MGNISGKTSQEVTKTGTYAPECCNVEMVFKKGATFQRCPECERLTRWEFVTLQPAKAA